MSEGKKITKEQAEACMRADGQFAVGFKENYCGWVFDSIADELWSVSTNVREKSCVSSLRALFLSGTPTIHADPNNTFERLFGTERELTFEEVGAALFRGETVRCEDSGVEYLLKLGPRNHGLRIDWTIVEDGSRWVDDLNWSYRENWKYTLYKEPAQPEPLTPEPLTLEALEARVKALEERS